jgi:hypothetical protein
MILGIYMRQYSDLGFVLTDFQNSLNMFDYSDFPAITKFIDTTAEDIVKANPNYQISRINNIINFDGMSYDQTRAADFLSFFLKLSTFSLQETLNFYEELERLKHMTNPNAGSMIPSQSFDQILQSCQEETPFSYSDMFYNCLKHYDNSKIDYPNNNKKLNLIIHNYPKDSLLYKEILSTNTYSTAYKVCQAVNPQDFITMMKQATSNVSEVTTIAYDYDNRIVQLIELDTDFVSYYQNFLSNNSNTPSLNAV